MIKWVAGGWGGGWDVTSLAVSIPSRAEDSEGTCDVDGVTEYSEETF